MAWSIWGWGEEGAEELHGEKSKTEARWATRLKLLVVVVLVAAVILGIAYEVCRLFLQ